MIQVQRHEQLTSPVFSLLDDMIVERGDKHDWEKLHHLHYKAENMPPAPKFWRCVRVSNGELVAVCVTSSVSLLLASRHDVLPKLKPGKDTNITNRHRPAWLNKNMRRVGRIVTSTIYRGTGVSYRMMNLVCRLEGARYMEIVSSMAKFNPFDTKAGFRRAPLRRAATYEVGITFMRGIFDCHPADNQAVLDELRAATPAIQKMIRERMIQFYYRHSSKEKTGQNLGKTADDLADMTNENLVRELQQLIFAHTVYALYENPDHGDSMPGQIPIMAFDNQAPHEKLNREKL
ncbi:hypothetical protein [Shewanella glacialipiscicola]|uniref:hypothetical protein n=1 Tax=Shewanella glacialipiscicola TaxID=614069 RepID=UPI003D7B77FE